MVFHTTDSFMVDIRKNLYVFSDTYIVDWSNK